MVSRSRVEVVFLGLEPATERPLPQSLRSALGWAPGSAVVPVSLGPTFDGAARARVEELALAAPVIVCLASPTEALVRQVIDAGASGAVPAGDVPALRAAATAVRAGLVVTLHHGAARRPPVLTPRERQILGLMTMRMTNGEIAARLVVSESTVKTHLANAYTKLGVRSRHEATDVILDPANRLGLGILSLTTSPAGAR